MKKVVKAASAFLSAAILSSALIISASAEETLSTKVTYKNDGTAVLEIAASEWENQVRYTTDGSVPTMDSKLYFSPLEITEKTTIRIAEFEDDKKIKGIKRTVKPKTAPVTFVVEQDYDDEKAYITLECETLGAKIYYTTDGSKPSEDSSLYLGPVEIDEKTKIRARAYCDGFATKTTYSKTVKVEEEPEQEDEDVEVNDTEKKNETAQSTAEKEQKQEEKKTVIEKDDEEKSVSEKISYKFTYMDNTQKTYVTLNKSKASNIIRYTTDGSAVTKESKKYKNRIGFTEYGVLRAKEYTKSGELVATLKINVKLRCTPVEFKCVDVAAGTYTIEMSTLTDGAAIYYTVDGSNPDPEHSDVYSYPLTLSGQTIMKAIAVKNDYKNSTISMEYAGSVPLTLENFDFSNPVYAELTEYFNMQRREEGLPDLILDENLTEAANVRAKEISFFYDHKRPSGKNYSSVFNEYGVEASFATEIMTSFKETPIDVAREVLGNKEDRARILDNSVKYDRIGVGCYEKRGSLFWIIILIRE